MRLAKIFISLGLVLALIACGTTQNSPVIESLVNEESTGKGDEQLQPIAAKEEQNMIKKPIDLISNQILIIKNQLYFYDVSQDSIKPVVQDGNIGLAIVSPLKKFLAVTKGHHGELFILNSEMDIEKKFNMQALEDQDFLGVGDLIWLGEERLLVGLDYNTNVRGYYLIDLNQEHLSAIRKVISKTGQGVIEVLDQNGEHFIYQYPNERSFSVIEKPALYLDDKMFFQGSDPSSWIGKISVNINKHQIIFPVTENSQTMFVTGQYDIVKNNLEHVERYVLDFAENEHLLDYVLDPLLHEGYVLSHREGQIRQYKWKRGELPSLVYLTTLPDTIHLSRMVLTNDLKLEIISNDRVYVYMQAEKLFEERINEVREYLVEKSKKDIDRTIIKEQITLIENF